MNSKDMKLIRSGPKNFILDFHVRWNSTFAMLKRFIKFKFIVNELSHNMDLLSKLKPKKKQNLEKLSFNSTEWDLAEMLFKNLKPFYEATKFLSARNYPSLSVAYFIKTGLKSFFNTANIENLTQKEKILRDRLLLILKNIWIKN